MKYNDYGTTNNEISLLVIICFFKENYKKILLGGVLGGMLSACYALLLPNTYQATANIQVAKVANVDVETPGMLVEKMKMPTYYSPNTYAICKVGYLSSTLVKGLNPRLATNVPVISLNYKERTSEAAKKCLESVLVDIRKNQDELAKPILDTYKKQLSNLIYKLQAAEQVIKILSPKKSDFDFSDAKFSASALLLVTTLNKENEVKDLREQINDLEIKLMEPQTKSTYLTAPIYAPDIRLGPKRTLFTLCGGVAGGFLVLILLLGQKTLASLLKPKPIL